MALSSLQLKVDKFGCKMDRSPNLCIFCYIYSQALNLIVSHDNAPFFNKKGNLNSTCVPIVFEERRGGREWGTL